MLKFLIVEDDDSIRLVIKTLLKRRFLCMVYEAVNGEDGLKKIKENLPDLVFMDISMPVLDGISALAIIRENPITKKVPVMMITAINDGNVVGKLVQLGIADYLLKPIDIDVAFQRINKFIIKLKEQKLIESTGGSIYQKEGNKPDILIVDKNESSRSMISEWLNPKYIIFEASTGTEALNIFSKNKPAIILFNDNLSLLDKKIITQKIPELAIDLPVSFYIIVGNQSSNSTKIFPFDGILKETSSKDEFMAQFSKVVLSVTDPIEIIGKFMSDYKSQIRDSLKMVFQNSIKEEINFTDDIAADDAETYYCANCRFLESADNVSFNISIFAKEKDIVVFTNKIAALQNREKETANELFTEFATFVGENFKSLLVENNFNIKWSSQFSIDQNKNFTSSEWQNRFFFSTKDNQIFIIAVSYAQG